MPRKATWWKLTVGFPQAKDGWLGLWLTRKLRAALRLKHVYFARYSSGTQARLEISLVTRRDRRTIARAARRLLPETMVSIAVTHRGTGSLAHAHAFRVIDELFRTHGRDAAALITELRDIHHWSHNMAGFNYLEEMATMSMQIASFCHQMVNLKDNVNRTHALASTYASIT